MARYVFDTSALVKRYHAELGSNEVAAIFSERHSRILISRLAIVECVSAFCLKARTGEIAVHDVPLMRKSLWGDVRRRTLSVSRLLVRHLQLAESLILQHALTRRLRAADAVHLGVALDLFRQSKIDVFVSTDNIQCQIAKLEGLRTINPLASVP